MSILDALVVVAVGCLAGIVNTIVGSGSLITFPILVAIGYGPVIANVSNTIGITFGSLSGTHGYRRELAGQQGRTVRLGCASLIGGLTGGVLLLTLPSSTFDDVIPFLILFAVVLVMVQPRLSRLIAQRRKHAPEHGGVELWIGILLSGIYGGYFGAAQGVILLALLGIFIAENLQRLNAVKNALAFVANGVAAVLFVFFADVAWEVVVLIAVGSVVGAQLGAHIGRRLPISAIRGLVIVIGVVAAMKLLLAN